jgi:hypothetical protein
VFYQRRFPHILVSRAEHLTIPAEESTQTVSLLGVLAIVESGLIKSP